MAFFLEAFWTQNFFPRFDGNGSKHDEYSSDYPVCTVLGADCLIMLFCVSHCVFEAGSCSLVASDSQTSTHMPVSQVVA